MIGALESCPCRGDLGDFFGRCGGSTMFGRCGGPTMSFTHGSVVSSLDEPTRSAVGFGLERLPGRRLLPGGTSPAFTPRGRTRLQGPISVDQLGPPPPSTVFVGVPAQWMEFGSKGRGRPAAGNARLAWDTTLTCDVDHVICRKISFFR
jgi:hypothetical protein